MVRGHELQAICAGLQMETEKESCRNALALITLESVGNQGPPNGLWEIRDYLMVYGKSGIT
jgi:hypothetical protein